MCSLGATTSGTLSAPLETIFQEPHPRFSATLLRMWSEVAVKFWPASGTHDPLGCWLPRGQVPCAWFGGGCIWQLLLSTKTSMLGWL